jgi:hypothetical protein
LTRASISSRRCRRTSASATRPFRRLLLGRERFPVRREVAAVHPDGSGADVDDLVDQLEQRPVVADHHRGAWPFGDQAVEPLPGVDVEVVRRLVEQQHIGILEEQRGQGDQHRLAAGDRADRPVQLDVSEAEPVEGCPGALLGVPVLTDGGEL